MTLRSKIRRAALIATAVGTLGLSTTGTASAAQKYIFAMLQEVSPGGPGGATYSGGIFAQGSGFYSDGSLGCLARSFGNLTTATGLCNATVTTYLGYVRKTGTTFCTAPSKAWDGDFSTCQVNINTCRSTGGCGVFTLKTWARGYTI